MYKITNECCDCGMPCLGSACPMRNVRRYYCDSCGEECAEGECYDIGGYELCETCAVTELTEGEHSSTADIEDEELYTQACRELRKSRVRGD